MLIATCYHATAEYIISGETRELHPNNGMFTALENLSRKNAVENGLLNLPYQHQVIAKPTNNNPLNWCSILSLFLISEKMGMHISWESLP